MANRCRALSQNRECCIITNRRAKLWNAVRAIRFSPICRRRAADDGLMSGGWMSILKGFCCFVRTVRRRQNRASELCGATRISRPHGWRVVARTNRRNSRRYYAGRQTALSGGVCAASRCRRTQSLVSCCACRRAQSRGAAIVRAFRSGNIAPDSRANGAAQTAARFATRRMARGIGARRFAR